MDDEEEVLETLSGGIRIFIAPDREQQAPAEKSPKAG